MKEYHRYGWEALDQPLYDFVDLHVVRSTPVDLFTVPIGAHKTSADTNMVFSGHLPKNNEFLIKRIKLITSGNDDTIMRVTWRGSIELFVGSTVYLTLPLLRLAVDPYLLTSPAYLLILENQNFHVRLTSPLMWGVEEARIGIELGGFLYRRYN